MQTSDHDHTSLQNSIIEENKQAECEDENKSQAKDNSTCQIIGYLENKLKQQNALIANYLSTIKDKDQSLAILKAENSLLKDRKVKPLDNRLKTLIEDGREILSKMKGIKNNVKDENETIFKLRIENQNLRNIIDELILKIRLIKDGKESSHI